MHEISLSQFRNDSVAFSIRVKLENFLMTLTGCLEPRQVT